MQRILGRLGLAATRREFERWRRGRVRGERIPARLWRAAVGVARERGVSETAQTLHVDYYALERRLEAETVVAPHMPAAGGRFVELSPPPPVGAVRCQVEICDRDGGKVRVDLSGLSASDLAAFVRAVAGRDP